MKTIIAGSRGITRYDIVEDVVEAAGFPVSEVVSGGARGVDELGEKYASNKGLPVKTFAADWTRHGRAAGPIRNRQMADYADALIAVWDGVSPGTRDMIRKAKAEGLDVHVYNLQKL